jgi:hypothetical protein
MTKLDDASLHALALELAARLELELPVWTDAATHDPGITLLELLSFAIEDISARDDHVAADRQRAISRLLERLASLRKPACETYGVIPRVRYFAGQILGADDLQAEQDYLAHKRRQHNLRLHGIGIVDGLDVMVESAAASGEWSLTVSPGFALGPSGEEIVVTAPLHCPLCAEADTCFVLLKFVERAVAPVPTQNTDGSEASRIEEGAGVCLAASMHADAVAIARLVRDARGWTVDASFKPLRC